MEVLIRRQSQCVRVSVAGLAARKFFEHRIAVRLAVAALTLRHVPMTFRMAVHARQARVFARACRQCSRDPVMTVSADRVGNILTIKDLFGGMDRMAPQTAGITDKRRMGRGMALCAFRHRAVTGIVTVSAWQ